MDGLLARLGVVFVLLILTAIATRSNNQSNLSHNRIYVGNARELTPGTITALEIPAFFLDPLPAYLPSGEPGGVVRPAVSVVSPVPIFVVVDFTGSLRVLYARDPFRGCHVAWSAPESLFADPCHGSRYARHGDYISGPANRGLDGFQTLTLSNGDILVDLSAFREGRPTGE